MKLVWREQKEKIAGIHDNIKHERSFNFAQSLKTEPNPVEISSPHPSSGR
jgi:hypothetical protein